MSSGYPEGTPVSRHQSLSQELRNASANLQQSLDALGTMSDWDAGLALDAPSQLPSGSQDGDYLLDRIQELEDTQLRYQKEQGAMRAQLEEKEAKLRKLVSAHRKLKAAKEGQSGSSSTPRAAQSMEARKRAAETVARKALTEKKELEKQNRLLKQQLRGANGSGSNGGGARVDGERLPSSHAHLQKERDLLRRQLEMVKSELERSNSSPPSAPHSTEESKNFLLSQRSRNDLQQEMARQKADAAALTAEHAEAELKLGLEAAARGQAERKTAEAEALAAELAQALSTLRSHCENLEASVATNNQTSLLVEDVQDSTRVELLADREHNLAAIDRTERDSRVRADQTVTSLVDSVVAEANQRFEVVLTDLDQSYSKQNEDAGEMVAKARRDVATQFEDRIQKQDQQIRQLRTEKVVLARTVADKDRVLSAAEATIAEFERRAESRVNEVRSESSLEVSQRVDEARKESEKGWSELVELLQNQADEAQEACVASERRAAESEQRSKLIEIEKKQLQDMLVASDSSSDKYEQMRKDMQAAEARTQAMQFEVEGKIAQARLETEQKTLEDVEGMIANLERDGDSLRKQLAIARASASEGLGDGESQQWMEELEAMATEERELRLKAEADLAQEKKLSAKLTKMESEQSLSSLQMDELRVQVADLQKELRTSKEATAQAREQASQAMNSAADAGEASSALDVEQQLRQTAEQQVGELRTELLASQAELLRVHTVQTKERPQHDRVVPELSINLDFQGAPKLPASTVVLEPHVGTRHISMHFDNVAAIYARADVNGDGNVSRAELVESVRRDPALQALFELPLGKRMGDEEREKVEAIFDIVDTDNSFGISLEEFVDYVNNRYAKLPVLPPGSYALGNRVDRVISVMDDASMCLTDPREPEEDRRLVFQDAPPPNSARMGTSSQDGQISARSTASADVSAAVKPTRRNRGGAFTYAPSASGEVSAVDKATAEIAELIGIQKEGIHELVDESFLARRHRFRVSMKQKLVAELRSKERASHELDLPGFWVRPTMSEAYEGLLQPFQVDIKFLDGKVCNIDCSPEDTMTDLLEMVYVECEEVRSERPEVPEGCDDGIAFVLKAAGYFQWLDGNEKLIDYRYIRTNVMKGLSPVLVAHPRALIVEQMAQEESVLNLEVNQSFPIMLGGSDSEDEEDYDMLERSFDPRKLRSTWAFIPVSEVKASLQLTLCGVDALVYPDGKLDAWVDPAQALGAFAVSPKVAQRGRRGSILGGKAPAPAPQILAKGMPSHDESGHGHGHGKKKKVETDPTVVGEDCVFVEVGIYNGGVKLHDQLVTTSRKLRSCHPRFNETLDFNFAISSIPRTARLIFTVYKCGEIEEGKNGIPDHTPLGWVGDYLYDDLGRLIQGKKSYRLWPLDKGNPIGTCEQNLGAGNGNSAVLTVRFPEYAKAVLYPRGVLRGLTSVRQVNAVKDLSHDDAWTKEDRQKVRELLLTDPLEEFSKEDKALMWKLRYLCTKREEGLAKVLRSADWTDAAVVAEVHRLLDEWTPLNPKQALELLDARFPDKRVRSYAVECLKPMRDDELELIMIQLVQVLKYEQSHDSQLACFLLTRSILCPNLIGHVFFWHLKAEMHVSQIAERYGVLLELYLEHVPAHRADLVKQNDVMEKLTLAARCIKNEGLPKKERLNVLREQLYRTEFPDTFGLPLDPEMVCKSLKVEKCKFMDSKKLPLWLVFENADPHGKDLYVIFKDGDDLRQDMLTLQMFKIMDNYWRRSNLNLLMIPYGCISTGDELGFIEVVLDSDTTANITADMGDKGARSVWQEDVYEKWLLQYNTDGREMDDVVERFSSSCAGYCVGTYALGIGDRHNDNVMLKKNGNLFHIDFGHFLGNYKSKFGIKREKAPFIFTPAFAYVLGGTDTSEFNGFVEQCCEAYNVLRGEANHFIVLFQLMLSTGIPELQVADDILYMRESLTPVRVMREAQASVRFRGLIDEALNCKTTQMNDAVHILVHQAKDARAEKKAEKKAKKKGGKKK